VDVEIVVDGDRLPRKIKHGRPALALSRVPFEGPHLLLRDAMKTTPSGAVKRARSCATRASLLSSRSNGTISSRCVAANA
jgi:hypothetical protein